LRVSSPQSLLPWDGLLLQSQYRSITCDVIQALDRHLRSDSPSWKASKTFLALRSGRHGRPFQAHEGVRRSLPAQVADPGGCYKAASLLLPGVQEIDLVAHCRCLLAFQTESTDHAVAGRPNRLYRVLPLLSQRMLR